eukprot:TRINITY_DN25935_c0_g2_i5.p1 TRINITY_DN25935_c0_g2~~TRINITY_DN25935_c0_g2_i5.p1  ORF type:complete len:661 (+),score=90.25 TRINITY_DN25935_c0_g2_i5:142-1983(+)
MHGVAPPTTCTRDTSCQIRQLQQALDSNHRQVTELVAFVLKSLEANESEADLHASSLVDEIPFPPATVEDLKDVALPEDTEASDNEESDEEDPCIFMPHVPEDVTPEACVARGGWSRMSTKDIKEDPPIVQASRWKKSRSAIRVSQVTDLSTITAVSRVGWIESFKKWALGTQKEKHVKSVSKALRNRAVFKDKSDMLEQVLDTLVADEYNVQDSYKQSGFCQAIARAPVFEHLSLLVITANALWLAIESDLNTEPVLFRSEMLFIVAENLFCAFFFFEWLCRLGAFETKMHGFRDSWFVFDGVLALCMVVETWVLSLVVMTVGRGISTDEMKQMTVLKLIRLMRLTRAARMVRLVRYIPELMIMLKGLKGGLRSVATTLLLLFLIVYVFAIAFRQITDGTPMGEKYFPSIPTAILHLVVLGIIPDIQDLVLDLSAESVLTGFMAFTFALIGSITVLNLLVGVLVEAVSVVACVEKDESAARFVKSALGGILEEADQWNGEADHEVTLHEFRILVSRQDFAKVMVEVGVDVANLVGLSTWLFRGGRTMPIGDFYRLIMQLRGSNYATVKDIVDMRKYLMDVMEHIEKTVQTCKRDDIVSAQDLSRARKPSLRW